MWEALTLPAAPRVGLPLGPAMKYHEILGLLEKRLAIPFPAELDHRKHFKAGAEVASLLPLEEGLDENRVTQGSGVQRHPEGTPGAENIA